MKLIILLLLFATQALAAYFPPSTAADYTATISSPKSVSVRGLLQSLAYTSVADEGYVVADPSVSGRGIAYGPFTDEQRTNLINRSSEFEVWGTAGGSVSVTTNIDTDPVNTTTADRLVSTAGGQSRVETGVTIDLGRTYTWSCYMKAGNVSWGFLGIYAAPTSLEGYFDLTNGTFSTSSSNVVGSIENVNNGWYRCVITTTIPFTAGALSGWKVGVSRGANVTSAQTGDYISVWGAQLEDGQYASSHIPTTTTAATRYAYNRRGWTHGVDRLSWVGWVDVPSTATAVNNGMYISRIANTNSGGVWPGFIDDCLVFEMPGNNGGQTGNELWITQKGKGLDGYSSRAMQMNTFRTVYSGQRIWLEVRITRGTSNPAIYVNSVNITSQFTATATGVRQPDWIANTMSPSWIVDGSNWSGSSLPQGCWIHGHLTDEESFRWRTTGLPPSWVIAGGGPDHINSSLSRSSGTTDSGITLTYSSPRNFRYTGTATSQYNFFPPLSNLPIGAKLRVSFSKNSGVMRVDAGGASITAQSANFSQYSPISSSGDFWYEFIFVGSGVPNFYVASGDTVDLEITNLKIQRLGAITFPVIQPILMTYDPTFIGNNSGRLIGCVPYTSKKDWTFSYVSTSNGNQRMSGGSIFTRLSPIRLSSWSVMNYGSGAGTKTISLGIASGGSTLGSSLSAVSGFSNLPLSSRGLTTSVQELWANISGTNNYDPILHIVSGQVLGQ